MVKVGRKETMTVAELREKLNEYPQDTPVFAAWEGVMASFKAVNFGTENYRDVRRGTENDPYVMVVCIDVEDYNS